MTESLHFLFMLSKSLIQLPVDGRGCLPSLLFGLRPYYGRGNGSNGKLLQKDLCPHLYSVPLALWQTTVNSHTHWRLLDTHRLVWLSLLWGHCTFLLGPGVHKVLLVPSKSLFPQSYGSSVIKSHWPPKSNSLRFSVPLLDPQIEKSVVSPRPFLTVFCSLWVICLVAL